jgi:undecaprenyl-diphosphatase
VGVNQPIVSAVREARPYAMKSYILVLADRGSDFSFPSDHATLAGAVVAGLYLVHRRLGALAAAAAVLVAFSRVYIAAHYPQDVAAGLLLGAAVVLVGAYSMSGRPRSSVSSRTRPCDPR